MKKILITIDQFGSSQYLPIHPTNEYERSLLGGVMTLILYGLSLAYFGYEIFDWLQNNKLPKITSIQQPNYAFEQQQSNDAILELGFYVQDSTQVNPFSSNSLIFIPVVQIITESGDQHHSLELKNVTYNDGVYPMFVFSDFLLKRDLETSTFQDYSISLRLCQEKYLGSGQKCADENSLNQFFSNPINWFVINTYISQYNTRTQKIEKIRKTTYINIQANSETQMQFEMELTRVNIDNGFLLPTENQVQYFSGYTIQQAVLTREQSEKQWAEKRYATIYYTLAQLKTQQWIEFPKVSEILADTGSIVTWILYMSLVVFRYNEYRSHLLAIEEIIETYYLDIKDFQFKKNIFGNFKSVSINNKKYDPEKFQQVYNKLKETAGQKINFVNLAYELSRIQFLLSTLLGIENISKMHHLGIKLEDQIDNLIIKEPQENLLPDKKIVPVDQLQSQDELNLQDLGQSRSHSHQDEQMLRLHNEIFSIFMKQEECLVKVMKDQTKQMDSKEDKSFCKQNSMQLEQFEQ